MVKFCCVVSCGVSGDGVDYFKFPVSGALRAAWRAASGAAGGAVCAAHFADQDYRSARGARRLLATAVPSVKLPKKSPPSPEKETNEPTETAAKTPTKRPAKSKKKGGKKKKTKNTTAEKQLEETTVEAVGKEIVETTEKEAVENEVLTKIDNKEADKSPEAICVKENGETQITGEGILIEEKDVEDLITNYQIQTKSLDPEPLEDLIPSILADHINEVSNILDPSKPSGGPVDGPTPGHVDSAMVNQVASRLANALDVQLNYPVGGVMGLNPMSDVIELDPAPVFIEVPVQETAVGCDASPEDCLMVMESVQCDVDPTSLMLPDPDSGSDMEILDVPPDKLEDRQRPPDPISLLTSSDEDEVILQEPKIDIVEVSDDTDEDDRPLQSLVNKPKPKPKPKSKSVFGMYQYYCEQCNYKTDNESHFKKHNLDLDHSTAIQICPSCTYTTASRAQFARHKRKHREDRNYKCNLCNYKARHSMSLMYHLKSHNAPAGRIPKFTCDKCGFYSDVKSEGLNHIKTCQDGRFLCDLCDYSTRRRSDLKRHMRRRHKSDDDSDFTL